MNLIIEAFIIGVYTSLFGIFKINLNIYFDLFIIGFLKHLIGYYSQLHNFYCSMVNKKSIINNYIIKDSIYEGICFIIIGIIIIKLFNLNNMKIALFLIGFIFHIIAEFIGLHKYFLKYRCEA